MPSCCFVSVGALYFLELAFSGEIVRPMWCFTRFFIWRSFPTTRRFFSLRLREYTRWRESPTLICRAK